MTVLYAEGTFTVMESKPTVEQFISDFFLERTATLKLESELHQNFRRRFYHNNCFYGSRRDVVDSFECQTIEYVSVSDSGNWFVTTKLECDRLRYHLKSSGESWLICGVDAECRHCRAKRATPDCSYCGGTGWRVLESEPNFKWPKRRGNETARTTSLAEDEATSGLAIADPTIVEFMNDHFLERTALLNKHLEIHTAFRKRFYAAECRWDNCEGLLEFGSAEPILNLKPVGEELEVITRHVNSYLLRYHLRPAGKSWVVIEVDHECLYCYTYGKSATCSFCGGKGWHDRKLLGGDLSDEPPGERPPPDHPRWKL